MFCMIYVNFHYVHSVVVSWFYLPLGTPLSVKTLSTALDRSRYANKQGIFFCMCINLCVTSQFRQLVEIAQCPIDQLPEDELTATSIKPEALSLFK